MTVFDWIKNADWFGYPILLSGSKGSIGLYGTMIGGITTRCFQLFMFVFIIFMMVMLFGLNQVSIEELEMPVPSKAHDDLNGFTLNNYVLPLFYL